LRALVDRALTPVRWFIVDAGAITDIDYSAAQSMRDLLDNLARQRGMVFARVSRDLRSDMDRHHITAAIGETRIFTTLHEAIAAVRAAARRGDGLRCRMKEVIRQRKKSGLDVKGAFYAAAIEPAILPAI
jgi:MFS superfamily sulfate permease-like transporter